MRPPETRRHGRARWWIGIVASVLLLAAVGVAARMLADFEWDRVVDYRSPYRFDLPAGEPTPRIVDRVVLVVIDGLRADTAADLPNMRALGEEGSSLITRASELTLSLHGWTTLTSGAPPEISGVTTNWYEDRVRVDSILRQAKAAGLTTAIVGNEFWDQLYGPLADHTFYTTDDRRRSDREKTTQWCGIWIGKEIVSGEGSGPLKQHAVSAARIPGNIQARWATGAIFTFAPTRLAHGWEDEDRPAMESAHTTSGIISDI